MFVLMARGDGYEARVVVDSLVSGTSSGGVRIAPDVMEEEVYTLAREMTYKYSFYRLRRGGAKTGIRIEGGTGHERLGEMLEDFGRKLSQVIWAGLYYPGMDMGCGPEELKRIYRGAGMALGDVTDTSYFTALSVRESILAVVDVMAKPKRPITLAIEGFGRVATHLMRMLPEEDYRVVAFSTVHGARGDAEGLPTSLLLEAREQHGDAMVGRLPRGNELDPGDVLGSRTDILVPSARTFSLGREHVNRIRAGSVVPIANAPYQVGVAEALHGAGIICLPGFVTNAGGVFGSGLFDQGISINDVNRSTSTYHRPVVKALLEASRKTGACPVDLARTVAERQLRRSSLGAAESGTATRLARAVWRRVRPRRADAKGALRRFRRDMQDLRKEIEGLGDDAQV